MEEKNVLIKNMTAQELLARAATAPAVILPLASMEILGKHGPVGLDLLVAEYAAQRIGEQTGCLVAPSLPYGDTLEFGELPGTVHVPSETLEAYIYAVARSLLTTCGAKALIFFSAHSLNNFAATAACRRLTVEGYRAATVDWWPTVGSVSEGILNDMHVGRGHGSEMITSVGMAVCNELMHIEDAVCEQPMPALERVNRWNGTPFRTFGNFSQYCTSGAWGNIQDASAEKGERLLQRGIEAVTAFIDEAFSG